MRSKLCIWCNDLLEIPTNSWGWVFASHYSQELCRMVKLRTKQFDFCCAFKMLQLRPIRTFCAGCVVHSLFSLVVSVFHAKFPCLFHCDFIQTQSDINHVFVRNVFLSLDPCTICHLAEPPQSEGRIGWVLNQQLQANSGREGHIFYFYYYYFSSDVVGEAYCNFLFSYWV